MDGAQRTSTRPWAAPAHGNPFGAVQATTGALTARRAAASAPSAREIEILSLIACGLSNAAIGRRLFISAETVKSHVQSLLAKLGARNRTHAVSVAIMAGLLDLDAQEDPAADRRRT